MADRITLDHYMTYEPSAQGAHIYVDSVRAVGAPVSERLFGLFTEHLGKNVYGGAWAQALPNPGFELFDATLADVPVTHRKDVARATDRRLQLAAVQFRMPGLLDYRQQGLAPYWAPTPLSEGTYSLECSYNGTAQQITAGTQICGIESPLFLPLHRTQQYQFQVQVSFPQQKKHQTPGNLQVEVWQVVGEEAPEMPPTTDPPHIATYGLDRGGAPIGEQPDRLLSTTTIPLDRPGWPQGQWHQVGAMLYVANTEVPQGARLKFRILIPAHTSLLLDQALLFPTDAIAGWDPEVVRLLRDMNLTVLRFPGGNFVSGYHWQDGVGAMASRPEKPNPAWSEWEPNHVGTNEWLTLCELVGAEPVICVNAGNGSPQEAADWVRYCNDPVSTPWGQRRAADGHPAPYHVHLWEIGNELWGDFQIGHCTSSEYGERFGKFAQAMLQADPDIALLAVGGSQPKVLESDADGTDLLGAAYAGHALRHHGEHVWAIAEHAVMGGVRLKQADARTAYLGLLACTHHVGELNQRNKAVLNELQLATKIAQTEQMVAVRGVDRPTDDSLAAAIVYAGFLNWFIRSEGLVTLFTRSALINHGDLLAKVREVVYPLPGYWAQLMYATQPGRRPIPLHIATP
jgi:alpha-N-arabinofuranosidase